MNLVVEFEDKLAIDKTTENIMMYGQLTVAPDEYFCN